ncbi:ATP-binding RNA helicase [Emydomyces testavorans]|uniref:RNA helicase n=1 Tax=Emydomyces testavorans TaxID=2070801 RepID=A0AAF0DF96_9EURO|nr:ATP-binding RNA helicase [Emydomyces testavorans]
MAAPDVESPNVEMRDVEDVPNPIGNMNVEAAALAREKGWAEPQRYDYAAYTASYQPGEDPSPDSNAPAWASTAAKYEWKDDYGDVGPRNEELEQVLFRDEYINRAGNLFESLREIKVTAETTHQPEPIKSFDDAGLHPVLLENVKLCGYEVPTPVQAYSIPAVLSGYDLIAVAQTGSGKTAAFLIPVLSKLMGKAKKLAAPRPDLTNGFNESVDAVRAEPLVLIVAPTRELATQIFDEARRLCYRSMLRPCVIYGGAPIREQRIDLHKGCDILIGTPGRLLDFMAKPNLLSLNRVKYTIIDEADEMLHSDWEREFTQIMSGGDSNEDADHRYMLFSATFNKSCRQLARRYLSTDHVIYTEDDKKKKALYDLILSMPPSRTLVFVNNKQQADLLDDFLFNHGLPSTSIHADRTQREREDAIRAFRTGVCPIMVATGVSARGLDIKHVMHVINYDLPSVDHGGIDEYIHRIGRTARIGNEGLATSFYNEDRNSAIASDLVKILLECRQTVPDFLEAYIPGDGEVQWDDDTDGEDNDEEDNATQANWGADNDGWGGDAAPAPEPEPKAASWNAGGDSAAW